MILYHSANSFRQFLDKIALSGYGTVVTIGAFALIIILVIYCFWIIDANIKWWPLQMIICIALGITVVGITLSLQSADECDSNAAIWRDQAKINLVSDNIITGDFVKMFDPNIDKVNYLKMTNASNQKIAKIERIDTEKIKVTPMNKAGQAYLTVAKYLQNKSFSNLKVDATVAYTRASYVDQNGKQSIICYANNHKLENSKAKVLKNNY